MIERRQMRAALLTSLAVVLLAGCGAMPESVPPTAPTTDEGTPATATPPGALLTFGNLATRINAAWQDVESYRITYTGGSIPAPLSPASPVASPIASPIASPAATPVARTPAAYVSVREVVLPDVQRQEVSGLGADDHEAISTPDGVFIRGPLVERIAPGAPAAAWIEIDPAEIPEGSALSMMLGGLPQVPVTPLSTLPQRLWPQQVRDLGEAEFDGRECHVYGAADTVAATGMRVDFSIAIDEAGLPCFVETSTGGSLQRRDEYTHIDGDIAIGAPDAATPVSIPAPLATPAIHD